VGSEEPWPLEGLASSHSGRHRQPRIDSNVMGESQKNKTFFHPFDKGEQEVQAGTAVLSIAHRFLSGLCFPAVAVIIIL